MSAHLTFKPLTPAEWPDFVTLFEEHGPQNDCWCMYWRTRRADVQRGFTKIAKDWPFERYMGIESTFEKAGFKVVLRKSDRRPVMRYSI